MGARAAVPSGRALSAAFEYWDEEERADLALMVAGVWEVTATMTALLPRKTRWLGAYRLMVALVPVLALLWHEQGLLWLG